MKSFTPNEGVGRAIVIITDGENHEGGAVEAAQEAAKKGIRVLSWELVHPMVHRYQPKAQTNFVVIKTVMSLLLA